jgi:hypothetical protein
MEGISRFKMKKNIQTRLGNDGNCYPTVVSCILDKDSAEDVLQIQEYYDDPRWIEKWLTYLHDEGCIAFQLDGHSGIDDEFYLVTGNTKRYPDGSVKHICIYRNGELWHDPHPDQSGLTTEEFFEIIKKIT